MPTNSTPVFSASAHLDRKCRSMSFRFHQGWSFLWNVKLRTENHSLHRARHALRHFN